MKPFRPTRRVDAPRVLWLLLMLGTIALGMIGGERPSRLAEETTDEAATTQSDGTDALALVQAIQSGEMDPEEGMNELMREHPGVIVFGAAAMALLLGGLVGGIILLVRCWQGPRIKPRASWAPGAPWSPFDVLEVLVFFIFAQVAISFVLDLGMAQFKMPRPHGQGALVLMAVLYVLSAAATVLMMGAVTPGGLRGLLRALRLRGIKPGKRMLQGVVGYAVIFPVFILAAKLSPLKQDPLQSNPVIPAIVQSAAPWAKLLALLLVGVCAPIFEETLFRGFAYPALKRRWGMAVGVVVTGLLFGMVHQYLPSMLALSVLGIGFALIYEATGSLVPCMVAHAAQNVLTFVFLMLLTT